MRKKRFLFGAMLTLVLTSTIAYAATPTLPESQGLFSSTGLNQKSIVDQFPIDNYAFDSADWKANLNPMYHLANGIFFFAIFLLRMAITIMNFGFHPPEMTSLIAGVLGITSQAVSISASALGLVGIVLVVMVVIDLGKRRPNVAVSRIIKVIVVMATIVLYSQLTPDKVTVITNATDSVASSFANVILSMNNVVPVQKNDHNLSGLAQATMNLDDQVWMDMAIYPFVMGEMGGNFQVKKQHLGDASQVPNKDLLNPPSSPYWYQSLLQVTVGDDARNTMRDDLIGGDYPGAKDAFSWTNRMAIAVVTFLASFGPILFMGLFGGLSFLLRVMFIFSLLAAIVIFILEMIPITRTNRYFMWWIKTSAGSLVGSVALSTYVGAITLVVSLIESKLSFGKLGAVFTILLNGAWYFVAIWLFFKLVKKYNPVSVWNQFVDQKMPKQMRFQPHKGSESASFDVTRNAGKTVGKSILSPNLLKGLNQKRQGASATPFTDQITDQNARRMENRGSSDSNPLESGVGETSTSPINGGSGGRGGSSTNSDSSQRAQRNAPFGRQPQPEVSPMGSQTVSSRIAQWLDRKAGERLDKTKQTFMTTKQALQQAPNRLKQLPSQLRRGMNPRTLLDYARRSWQEANKKGAPSTLLGKAIADFKQIQNTPDAHALTRYALGAAETVTKGAARALGKTALKTAQTGLKATGIASASTWMGMRKGQRYVERKSMEMAVKSQVKLHELSWQRQLNQEVKRFIRGLDDWKMVAFHGKAHVSTVDPEVHPDPPGAQPTSRAETNNTSIVPVKREPNYPILQQRPKPELQIAKKSGVPSIPIPKRNGSDKKTSESSGKEQSAQKPDFEWKEEKKPNAKVEVAGTTETPKNPFPTSNQEKAQKKAGIQHKESERTDHKQKAIIRKKIKNEKLVKKNIPRIKRKK